MHIVNIMFSKGQGGIEQAQVDYCEALKMAGYKVSAIISKKAKIKDALLLLGINIIEVKNFAVWDFFAKAYLRKILKQLAPDAVILHGNRAVCLVKSINKSSKYKLIGVTHNYSIKHLIGLDLILAITNDLRKKVIEAGQSPDRVVKLPNMVRIKQVADKSSEFLVEYRCPIVIGAMGRFVKKKGFDVFIRAIAEIVARGQKCEVVLGGGGEEEQNLKELASSLGLGCLSFSGWVKDKQQFFADIDIFCLPSLQEPFGIILLEAFAHKKPIITSDAEGPSEIANNNIDAIIVQKGNVIAMADAIMRLAADVNLARQIAQNGFAKAACYDISKFSAALKEHLCLIKNT